MPSQLIKMSLLLCWLISFGAHAAEIQLSPLNINRHEITSSGVSSGAFMSVQLHIAHSQTFSGAASIAGGVYWCSQGDSQIAQSDCTSSPKTTSPDAPLKKVSELEASGLIDETTDMQDDRVLLFSSDKDTVVNAKNSVRLNEFYKALMPAAQIKVDENHEAAHGFPTLSYGNPCGLGFSPWLLKCNYDMAAEILSWMLNKTLDAKVAMVPENLKEFSQTPFIDAQTPLYKKGWIYIPTSCAKGESCALHVALHGCMMTPDSIQDKFVKNAGYNEWAEANHVVVLYPQSIAVTKVNPYGCWDWFGFTGQNFMTQKAPQIKAIKAMVDVISGH